MSRGVGSEATVATRWMELGTRLGSGQAESPAVVVATSTPRRVIADSTWRASPGWNEGVARL